MKRFAELFARLDETNSTNRKVEALAAYFSEAPDADRMWGIALFSGRRPRRAVTTTELRTWAAEEAGLPSWLLDETYSVVGDLAETIALVLPPGAADDDAGLSQWISRIDDLKSCDTTERRARVVEAWRRLDGTQRFLFNKLITGGFRIGVSQKLMTRALAKATGLDEALVAHRIMGQWNPKETTFTELVTAGSVDHDIARPFPFFLAYPLESAPDALGDPADWMAEHKWDGIRGQLVVRAGEVFVWSRGEEIVTDRFPEFTGVADQIPDGTVLDGEILAWKDDAPLSFNALQTRSGRSRVAARHLKEAPVVMMTYDILEWNRTDLRHLPLAERRQILDLLFAHLPADVPLRLSSLLEFDDWAALRDLRETSRGRGVEGLMLKHRDSPYRVGRRKGEWWKWKVDPLSIDAVLVYAEAGHGRRANLYTDFTFAVRTDSEELVPFTKAYSGLTDAEFREITAWVRRNTLERFGPLRRVRPEHVFEIAFEGVRESPRHKSGIALRFPRMKRWRRDKKPGEANTLADLRAMLDPREA